MWQLYRKTPENLRFSDKLLEGISKKGATHEYHQTIIH